MPVAVTALCEALAAMNTSERSQTFMSANMIHNVAHLREPLTTSVTFEHLVLSTGLFVHLLHLSVTFLFSNDALVLILIRFTNRLSLLALPVFHLIL